MFRTKESKYLNVNIQDALLCHVLAICVTFDLDLYTLQT